LNEEFTECGTACPATCDQKGPIPCTKWCIPGCFCKKGYILDRKGGACVRETECKPQCGPNEQFNACGTECPRFCGREEPVICPPSCVKGCFCKDGYILDRENGVCIPETQCKTECGPNEQFNVCGTACPRICGRDKPEICTKNCVQGCFCKDGYIRDPEDEVCIPETQCKRMWFANFPQEFINVFDPTHMHGPRNFRSSNKAHNCPWRAMKQIRVF
uniref:TIL domain-containing protein n=1 Tax=Anisakis simplex TaxID=6269 RepID=A0A0M3J5U6_ANISI